LDGWAELKKFVEAGQIRHLGLSEASPEQIRNCHAIHPVACVQQEWSLGQRDLELDIVPTCRELGVGIVC